MAVKLYTPDDNVIVHQAKVDFRRRIVQRQVNLVQYDKSMPIIAVQLYSNGNEYVLPENASAYIRFGKRDHTYVYNECLGCDQTRTIVYFAITDQMTIFYGEHTPIVELRIGDTVAGSGSIPIWIDRNPIQNGDTESKSDLSVFEKAIEAAQKINVKLPTDLKATATNLSLLAGATKIGSGINLSGFEYDEATNTLKVKGSVSPFLNLINMEDSSVRTSITEEEKTNLENGLYNSVLYADLSKGEAGFYSAYFPETMATIVQGNPFFSTYDISVDESTGGLTITGTSVYGIAVEEEKNADGTYPIRIQKAINGTFGGGGGGGGSSTPSTSIAFKDITVSELANYVGKFENLHITDLKIALTDTPITGAYFSGIIGASTSLQGGLWISFGSDSNQLIYLGNGGYAIKNGVIKGGNLNVGSFNAIRMGELNTLSSLLKFNSSIGADMLSRVPDEGNFAYIGTLEDNNGFGIAICSSSAVNLSATGEETYCKFTGLFREGKGIGCMEMKKGANDVPQFKSFTTWLPPVTANSNGKALIVTDGNAQWTNIPRYEHTITIKNSAGAILWTQTMRNSSNTIVNSYANLKTLFGEATYAGFGEYCQLNLEGGTEATDKLIKADGTEATLASLGAIVYTDKCFLPK